MRLISFWATAIVAAINAVNPPIHAITSIAPVPSIKKNTRQSMYTPAATMVAAGVYMLCRVFFLIEGTGAMEVIAWIGGFTALMAATIAVAQNDIKRILAYSTLSQLGYMVMAVGLAGRTPAMFHLTTHAFFKALLFLGAGSV